MSKNGIALIVLFLSLLGVESNENNVAEVVSAVFTIASFLTMLYHQVMEREDAHNLIFKIKGGKVE
jgi:hypothetical protein